MKPLTFFFLFLGVTAALDARAQSVLETIGVTDLLQQDPSLTGSGVIVAQIESAPSPLDFEVSPGAADQSVKLFTFRSSKGSSVKFPNSVGVESSHADSVAQNLYGIGTGVAPGLQHVMNYETDYFYAAIVQHLVGITSRVFNQSFELGNHNAAQDQVYDNYIASHHTLVASGIGNGGPILTPADCYNGLGVAAYGGSSSTGPSVDGRCKPDITAPAGATSFSTPLVSGAAALLIQEGRRQGVNAARAIDSRTIKALLLNGANKPSGWSHTETAPLDSNYGAGVLDVFNSSTELLAGRHIPSAKKHERIHAPLTGNATIDSASGWDYNTILSTGSEHGDNHYRISVTGASNLAVTLVWNKHYQARGINRLELFVYNQAGVLQAASTSAVDNVQHIYLTGLSPGTYEIDVVKIAGPGGTPGVVSGSETYALVWDFLRRFQGGEKI